MSAGISLSTVASVVGIAGGVSSLLGGGSTSGSGNVAGGAYYDPFASSRGQYATQLNQLMANPSSVTQTPGYQFGMNQGTEALNRTYAASGQGGSGAQLVGLQNFAQNYAGQQFANQESNLAQLSGATQSPMNVTGQNQLNQQGQQQGLSNIMGGLSGLSNMNFGSTPYSSAGTTNTNSIMYGSGAYSDIGPTGYGGTPIDYTSSGSIFGK